MYGLFLSFLDCGSLKTFEAKREKISNKLEARTRLLTQNKAHCTCFKVLYEYHLKLSLLNSIMLMMRTKLHWAFYDFLKKFLFFTLKLNLDEN